MDISKEYNPVSETMMELSLKRIKIPEEAIDLIMYSTSLKIEITG